MGKHVIILFLLVSLLSCNEKQEPLTTPWGTTIGDTVEIRDNYSLYDIVSNGEMIMLTLSGPDTYYEYRGRGMGTQYLLCEKFAQHLGISLRVELCRDTMEMVSRLEQGEGDIIVLGSKASYSLSDGKGKEICFLLPPQKRKQKEVLEDFWTVRADNRELADSINKWYRPVYLAQVKQEQNYAFSSRSMRRRVYSPLLSRSKGVISNYDHLFKQYAPVAQTDWRMLAALSYQESCFDPNARSWAGACGLMQIMPATATRLGLPVSQIFDPEANIAASARYISQLGALFNDVNHPYERMKFILASYNGGYGHVRDAMALARKDGRDARRWDEVSQYILHLSEPQYYRDPAVKNGYMRGTETYNYVRLVTQRYNQYCGVVGGSPSFGSFSGSFTPRKAARKHRFK